MKTVTSRIGLAALVALTSTAGAAVIFEDFSAGDGGFTVLNTGDPTGPWSYDAGLGTWSADGSDNLGAPSHSRLTSPLYSVDDPGSVTLIFDHRYSIESDNWDAGAVFTSINGGAFTQVPAASFTLNGYTAGPFQGNHDLKDGVGFGGDSPGYEDSSFITSSADLGTLNPGDTLQIQFLGAWDEFAGGTFDPEWEIDSVIVSNVSAAVPEPSSGLCLLLAFSATLMRRRRA